MEETTSDHKEKETHQIKLQCHVLNLFYTGLYYNITRHTIYISVLNF